LSEIHRNCTAYDSISPFSQPTSTEPAQKLAEGSANKRGPKECSPKTSLAYSLWTSRSPACREHYTPKKYKGKTNKKATNIKNQRSGSIPKHTENKS